MDCNANNFCCPPTHTETLIDEHGEIIAPCCRLETPGPPCVKYQVSTDHTYSCYDPGTTVTRDIDVTESCELEYGAYGRIVVR